MVLYPVLQAFRTRERQDGEYLVELPRVRLEPPSQLRAVMAHERDEPVADDCDRLNRSIAPPLSKALQNERPEHVIIRMAFDRCRYRFKHLNGTALAGVEE